MSSILDFTVLSLNEILLASSRVTEFLNDSAMRYSFTNFSLNGFKFFAIKYEITYNAIRAFSEDVALSTKTRTLLLN